MKIYFASDAHLGAAIVTDKREHERKLVTWLDAIKDDADAIYFLGDMFDYWYEYKTVVPKGYVRFLAKLCELTERGIDVHMFTGNHDVWMFDYLPDECGVTIHRKYYEFTADGKHFLVGHGDNIGNYDKIYMLMKMVFESPVAQWFYSKLHPDFSGWIAHSRCEGSRRQNEKRKEFTTFRGEEREFQIRFAKEYLSKGNAVDYFVFGHRHIMHDFAIGNDKGSRVLMIGDWLKNFSYAVFDGNDITIEQWTTT